MISFKQVAEVECEDSRTSNDPLITRNEHDRCEEIGLRPFGLAFRSSKPFITFVIVLAVFADAFIYTMIIPILPDELTKNAGVAPKDVQKWISILLSGYGVTNFLVSPLVGYVADWTSSRRIPLLFGQFASTLATVLYCIGRNPLILFVSRCLQGASAAIIWVVGLALLSDTIGAGGSGIALGWSGVGRFLGVFLGPAVSGVVYEFAGHYAVFSVAFVILFFDMVLRYAIIERKVAEKWITFSATSTYGRTTPIHGLQTNVDPDNLATRINISTRNSSVYSKITVTDTPESHALGMVPLLKSPRFLAALCTYFTCAIITKGVECVLSIYTMSLFNWTVAQSGLIYAMMSFSIACDPYLGWLTDKYGCRRISISGLVLGIFLWLALCYVTANTTSSKVVLAVGLLLQGFASGLMVVPNMAEISSTVEALGQAAMGDNADPTEVMGRAFSLLNMSWGLGAVIGPIWGGVLIQEYGWVVLCMSFVGLQALAIIFALKYAGLRNVNKEEAEEVRA